MFVAVADTHTLLWYLFQNPKLSQRAKASIDAAAQAGDQIAVSSISLIEMVYLIEKGRISSESMNRTVAVFEDPTALFVEIPVERQIARALARVDVTQIPDMPDRIVAATAVHLNVPIISRDGQIQLSTLRTIW